jgi:hypothetical protein
MNLTLKFLAPRVNVEKNSGKKQKKTASFRALLKRKESSEKGQGVKGKKKEECTVILDQRKAL